MDNKNFVNFHVLISHSPSCLNRDDMNMQKTAVFGGVSRIRISSQSLKRAMRKSDYYSKHLGVPSFRTRDMEKANEELYKVLKDEFDRDLIEEAAKRFVADVKTSEEEVVDVQGDEEGEDEEAGETKNKLAVAPWIAAEMQVLCHLIKEVKSEGLTKEEREKALKNIGKKPTGKGKDKKTLTEKDCLDMAIGKKIEKKIAEKMEALRFSVGTAVDVALSGRMATSGLMLPVDGAFAVAHVITTHAVEPPDEDWFTAVDDLTLEAGKPGAAHLNTQQFSSGVFYRYASLNLKQLQVNMGLIQNIKSPETEASRTRALEIAKHVFHMLATIVPSAKQQTYAAHNLADFTLVSFADQPISLANAFECPVKRGKDGGFLRPSELELVEYWRKLNSAYDLNEKAAAFCFDDVAWRLEEKKEKGFKWPDDIKAYESLGDVENWIAGDGKKR